MTDGRWQTKPNYGKERRAAEIHCRLRRYLRDSRRLKRGQTKGISTITKATGGGWIWDIQGIDGTRKYMGYTKEESMYMYHEEYRDKIETLAAIIIAD